MLLLAFFLNFIPNVIDLCIMNKISIILTLFSLSGKIKVCTTMNHFVLSSSIFLLRIDCICSRLDVAFPPSNTMTDLVF